VQVSTKLRQIAERARQIRNEGLRTLAHCIDVEFLEAAYRRTRKDGAPGVDGQTAADYKNDLDENLGQLLERFKAGTYRAPAVRRVHIPKGDGSKTRPIGIPTFEDKVLQRAVTMVLEAIYEQEFYGCSYGFRPARSAHQATEALWKATMDVGGGWVIDADIRSFFDTLDHGHLRTFLGRRVRDGVILRAIGKWLNAGVLEGTQLQHPEAGTPQGGVISPLLGNVYLHEVLDKWFYDTVRPALLGPGTLIRYADDFAIVCANEKDAQRILEALPRRFAQFGLTIHPEKTRLVDFRGGQRRSRDDDDRRTGPGTLDFLGFTWYWGWSRKGRPVVQRKTSKSRFNRAVQSIAAWCQKHRHDPVEYQHRVLTSKLRGHDAYYGVTGNCRALQRLRHAVARVWRRWLDRRGGRRRMSWERFASLLQRYPLPPARVIHSVYRA
jgi:group II intron reverse transcriptase/maturase